MSVRHEPAETTRRGAATRRLHMTTPMGVSLVAVIAVAIMAVALVVGPRGLFGLGAASPTPSPSAATASPMPPDETPTAEPTATPSPTPTPQPAPTPVPMWTGLEWSEPILRTDDEPWLSVIDSVRWNDGYVGVGSIAPTVDAGFESNTVIPAFLWSDDGTNWEVVQDLGAQRPTTSTPRYVVASDDRLLAMAWGASSSEQGAVAPGVWYSDDGRSWTPIESQSWADGWNDPEASGNDVAVAGGPAGFVVIGAQPLGGCCLHPVGTRIIGQSADGQAWAWLADAPAFADASFTDVQATPEGFVLAGRVGAPMQMMDSVPLGRPAAWFSGDGATWVAADVEGPEVVGGQISDVLVGADGLFGIGVATPDTLWWERTSAWASSDGRDWRLIDGLEPGLLSAPNRLSDGIRMVILGRDALTATSSAGWTSSDGVTWIRLELSGSPPVFPYDGYYSASAEEAWAHDPAYYGASARMWSGSSRLQDAEIIGYGWVATTADPYGDGSFAKWIATRIEP